MSRVEFAPLGPLVTSEMPSPNSPFGLGMIAGSEPGWLQIPKKDREELGTP